MGNTMKIKDHIDEYTHDRETLYVTECYYSITEQGAKGKRPLIHLCGQDTDGEYSHVTVDGFRPYFFISESEYEQRRDDIHIEINSASSQIIDVEHGHEGLVTGGKEPLVKLTCCIPTDVRDKRGAFEKTWEADILFSDRFMEDLNITDAISVPHDAETISPDDIRTIDNDGFDPRIITFDIEVAVGDDGFPDVTIADKPITAITAHDSLTDTYWTGVLEHPKWDNDTLTQRNVREAYENHFPERDGTVEIFPVGRDDALLYDFIDWVHDHHPTVMMAWNGNDFDVPYIVNRALNEGCNNIKNLSPTEYVSEVEDVGWDTESCIRGIQFIDNIEAYEKTNIHELKSNKLDDVAAELLGHGKEDIDDIDGGWKNDPEQFTKYNIRDVTAVVEIMDECGAMDLYSNIQSLIGVPLNDMDSNKRVVDQAILREALHNEF